jgi:hypothetical protein
MAKKKSKATAGALAASLPWPAGLRPTPIRQKWHKCLSDCPIGLSLKAIAERLGQPYASVAFWAKKLRYPFTPLKRGRKSRIDWNRQDWSLKNCELARQLGVSGERVRQVRRDRSLPPTPRLSEDGRKFRQFVRENRHLIPAASVRSLISASGAEISPTTAQQILKQLD